MKCKECEKEGKKSFVMPGLTMSTSAYYQPYYDEDGKYHNHDGNAVTTSYYCSNDHHWHASQKKTCPNCDWGK
jgi:hypothetical protein